MILSRSRLPRALKSDLLYRLPSGHLLDQPWFDRATFALLKSVLFPLLRLWAAATMAQGDLGRFREGVPLAALSPRQERTARRGLQAVQAAVRVKLLADADWEEAFFGPRDSAPARLVAAELRRRAASHVWINSRWRFLPLLLGGGVKLVRFDVASKAEVHDRYGAWLADPDTAYGPPETIPEVERSRPVPGSDGHISWLRFRSPGLATEDTAWARVIEPVGVADPPTLIYCHGLAEAIELRKRFLDETAAISRLGLRVIRLEAPWHNRRLLLGQWSGEPFLGRAPMGPLDLFEAQLKEIAILIAWCRAQSDAPVAIGGLSMGALTTQLAATRARRWPAEMQPDALFLAATSEDLWEICFTGAIGRAAGVGEALMRAGWTNAELEPIRRLTNPIGPPVMEPGKIVMVLGRNDDVTPFGRGHSLAQRWGVPSENLFLRDQGHFTIPLGLLRDERPLARLAAIMKGRA